MLRTTLSEFLIAREQLGIIKADVVKLLISIAECCHQISLVVKQGRLAGAIGQSGTINIQGERQQKLDVLANQVFIKNLEWQGLFAAMASEEMDTIYTIPNRYPIGDYLILFDPLDGSSNIEINVSIGTIFSVFPVDKKHLITEKSFLQQGKYQLIAGYALYGTQTQFVFTTGDGVHIFTLDNYTGQFILTGENLQIPLDTQEFAINMSNYRRWQEPMKKYIDELLAGKEGERAKDFNMRWVASLVAEVHRIINRGGIFAYPTDDRAYGKLRLLYEANPVSFIVEQAGGAGSNTRDRILEIQPKELHERVPLVFGAFNEVSRINDYHSLLKRS